MITQARLFACLVLKTFFKTDYRGICALLVERDAALCDVAEGFEPDIAKLQCIGADRERYFFRHPEDIARLL